MTQQIVQITDSKHAINLTHTFKLTTTRMQYGHYPIYCQTFSNTGDTWWSASAVVGTWKSAWSVSGLINLECSAVTTEVLLNDTAALEMKYSIWQCLMALSTATVLTEWQPTTAETNTSKQWQTLIYISSTHSLTEQLLGHTMTKPTKYSVSVKNHMPPHSKIF